MTLQSLMACGRTQRGVTPRDGLIGAGVMLGVTVVMSVLGIVARRNGFVLRRVHAVDALLADERPAVEGAGTDHRHHARANRRRRPAVVNAGIPFQRLPLHVTST